MTIGTVHLHSYDFGAFDNKANYESAVASTTALVASFAVHEGQLTTFVEGQVIDICAAAAAAAEGGSGAPYYNTYYLARVEVKVTVMLVPPEGEGGGSRGGGGGGGEVLACSAREDYIIPIGNSPP